MIRTKAYLIREITQLKKQKSKLSEELDTLKAYNKIGSDLKKAVPLIAKEINDIEVKIKTLYWCANTSEKQLPKLKKKKKKKKDKEVKKKEND